MSVSREAVVSIHPPVSVVCEADCRYDSVVGGEEGIVRLRRETSREGSLRVTV